MYDIPTWPNNPPNWMFEHKAILLEGQIIKHKPLTLNEIEENSEAFPVKFPIDTSRCKAIRNDVPVEILERNISSAYPVITEDVLLLYAKFLSFKRQFGIESERILYANMSIIGLVDRLLLKRLATFVGVHDYYVLLDGRMGAGIENLHLDECLTYHEIELSALLSVSSYSHFINDGRRRNVGVPDTTNVEEEGIVVGLIGTRLVTQNVMEYQQVVISKNQNQEANGYGPCDPPTFRNIVFGFYEEPCLTHAEIEGVVEKQPHRFIELGPGSFFDKTMYCKRLALSFDTLLLEGNGRANAQGTTAFIHVVGIGLGVWKIREAQDFLFLDTFAKRIETIGNSLRNVSDVVFSYFPDSKGSGGYKNNEVIPLADHPFGGITIHFSNREPHTKLTGNHEGKLLVVSYAWDGNALPGNEFWSGSLAGSGDPAQACSSQVAELHNPHINPLVCGSNLRIATRHGLIPFSTYRENVAKSGE